MKILFTGGGTGGHILPIIAIAREIRRIVSTKDLELIYLGPKDEFGSIWLSQEGIKTKMILSGKIRRYLTFGSVAQNIFDLLFKIPLGILQGIFYVFFSAPDLVFSKGGYGSLSAVLGGWVLRVPIFLHESDVSPGLSNRFLARFASRIFVSFPENRTEYFSLEKMSALGNPIRREILEGSKNEARELFKLTFEKPVILVLGGSQGAQRMNEKISQILEDFLAAFEIIHQCGDKNYNRLRDETRALIPERLRSFYHLFPFLKEAELKQAYAACDLIVSRAGSGRIFEIAAIGKPSILVPLSESAQNHQVKNAYAYAENGACQVLEEANFTPRFFLEKIKEIFSRPEELAKMGQTAKSFSKPDAAKNIAIQIVNYLGNR